MSTIQLKTAIPGPKSKALSARRAQSVARGLSHATPVYVARAEGAVLEDVDGNRYIDLAGGIGCLNVGHRSPEVVTAIHNQLDNFLHTCVQVTAYENYVELAERLNRLAPGTSPKKTILLNTGAEAVENAVKIARAYTKKPGIIAFEDAFHGRTMMTLALTSKTHPYKAGFHPFPSEVYRIPYAYCYRCSYNLKYPSCDLFCARHLEDTFKRVVAQEGVAAVIAEPVLGEGGFVAPPKDFFKVLLELCHKHNVLFVADEVQSGFGRTGALFACEYYGIEPDLLITAKSIGGGLPLAAVTGRAEVMDAVPAGGLGGTFTGNPVSCAAAIAVLEALPGLRPRAEEVGRRVRERLTEMAPESSNVRGLGPMIAVELPEQNGEETARITKAARERGLILLSCGIYGNVIRILVPFTVTDAELDRGLDILQECLGG